MRIIPYYGVAIGETREASFLEAFDRKKEITRIVSFGSCNYACPYCMRDAQFVDEKGNTISSKFIPEDVIFSILEKAVLNNERVRLSGGDPSLHLKESLKIGKWLECYNKKLSLCHNGSNLHYIKKMLPYLEYAAIDLKGITAKEYSIRAGIDEKFAEKNINNFFKICNVILENNILLDIRTCVFSNTSLEDLLLIASKINLLKGNLKFWTIRNYDPVDTIDWKPMDIIELEKNIQIISIKYPNLKLGYRDKWSNGKFIYWENNISKEIGLLYNKKRYYTSFYFIIYLNMKKIRFAVGALIFMGKKILLVKKVKMMDGKKGVEDIKPFWDFPKGGVKEGENYEKALYRELKEEIGTNKFKLISSLEDFKFDFSESVADKIGYESQITKMFLVKFLGKEDDLKIMDDEIGDLNFFEINKAVKKATMLNSKKYIKSNFK